MAHRPTVSVQAAYAQSTSPLQIPLSSLLASVKELRPQQQAVRVGRTPYALKLQERLSGGARSRSSISLLLANAEAPAATT